MYNRIDKTFALLREQNRKAFIPFTVLGYPDRNASLRAIETMIENGADVLELGLPFSDPMADGPIIESASKTVVETGFTTSDALQLIESVRKRNKDIPIVVMSYFNLALARGIEQFMKDLKHSGVDGITFVDLPPEEGESVFSIAKENGIAPVMLVSPLTSPSRLQLILTHASGYLYLISRAGTTGLAEKFDDNLTALIAMLRLESQLPVCIGFGISKPAHVTKMLALGADGVVVGSKLVEILREDCKEIATATSNASEDTSKLADAVRNLADAAVMFNQRTQLVTRCIRT